MVRTDGRASGQHWEFLCCLQPFPARRARFWMLQWRSKATTATMRRSRLLQGQYTRRCTYMRS
eukprot:203549-Karenia_brevis.AAC.1